MHPTSQTVFAGDGLTQNRYQFMRRMDELPYVATQQAVSNYIHANLSEEIQQLASELIRLQLESEEGRITQRELRFKSRDLRRDFNSMLLERCKVVTRNYGNMRMWDLVGSNGVTPAAYTYSYGLTAFNDEFYAWWLFEV